MCARMSRHRGSGRGCIGRRKAREMRSSIRTQREGTQ
jgi:hypothetical protein